MTSLSINSEAGGPPASELPVAQAKAELFKSLAHPARIRVLEVLSGGERPVGELAQLIDLEKSHLSHQLGVLRRAGVVATRRDGASIYYSLKDGRMSQIIAIAREMIIAGLRESQDMLQRLDDSQ